MQAPLRPDEDSFFRGQEETSTHIGLTHSALQFHGLPPSAQIEESKESSSVQEEALNSHLSVPFADCEEDESPHRQPASSESESCELGYQDTFTPASWHSGHSTLRARELNDVAPLGLVG